VCGPSPTHMPGYIRPINQAQQIKIDSLARTLRGKGYTCDRTVCGLPLVHTAGSSRTPRARSDKSQVLAVPTPARQGRHQPSDLEHATGVRGVMLCAHDGADRVVVPAGVTLEVADHSIPDGLVLTQPWPDDPTLRPIA